MILGVATLLAFSINKFVERLRAQFGILNGQVVAIFAYAVGIVAAFGFNVELFSALGADYGINPSPVLDKIFSGFAMGAGAGFIADVSKGPEVFVVSEDDISPE